MEHGLVAEPCSVWGRGQGPRSPPAAPIAVRLSTAYRCSRTPRLGQQALGLARTQVACKCSAPKQAEISQEHVSEEEKGFPLHEVLSEQ